MDSVVPSGLVINTERSMKWSPPVGPLAVSEVLSSCTVIITC
ncbi:MAG: hypothetical protein ACXACB_06255 [Promethearchaeota archaeon]